MSRKIRLQKPGSDRLRERFERELNEAQRLAATAPDGFNLILAGPGSGKTRVITYRVAYLIARGVAPESILLVTFTRRAAREMISRLEGIIGPKAMKVWAGTFHHVGNRILRKSARAVGYDPNFTILDGEDQRDLVKLALEDAGLVGTGRYAPKPATVQHLISFAFNVKRPLAELIAERHPDWIGWAEQVEAAAAAYERRKRASNCMDYDDLLGLWSRLITENEEQRSALGRMFRHLLVDEMQDTNLVQVELVEAIARAGEGNLTAVGDDAQSIYKFRGAHYDNILKFPERNPGSQVFRLETNYRSTPEIVAFTNASISKNASGFPKTLVSAREGGPRPVVVATADAYEEADLICQQVLDWREEGIGLSRVAVLYRNHHDSILLQGELAQRGIPYTVRSGMRFFEQAHIKDVMAYLRVQANPKDEPAWARLLPLLPGIGPAKSSAIRANIMASENPIVALESPEAMKLVPVKSKGEFAAFVADLRSIRKAEPESNPSAAILAVLKGGYPGVAKARYEHPDQRLADVEQLSVLAARYDSLDKFVADMLLAGDVYGMDSLGEGAEPDGEQLVLSTIHQAKGLEWFRVIVPRLVEHGFPGDRALAESGGEDEERRVFYVAVTRAMDELWLTYPLMVTRPGQGSILTSPSRFVTEVDPALYEVADIESENDLAWTEGPRA
ncbi:ATP-dependent helicase [Tautonia plasticadhaerens]|uniref:DNA 3'-5' helicase n=1 Tax=Tautonia plasticadhaerens TaxID=2527974 RepID=A0A518HC76_9BACT|nr:ATP-dependent helicase [Tautonia plasticadhaerens]QDV38465.1 ATP-dependent DNA helicase PcrA [Tautonia plasticadhaerens]